MFNNEQYFKYNEKYDLDVGRTLDFNLRGE